MKNLFKYYKRFIRFAIALMFFSFFLDGSVVAQISSIKGKVIDEGNNPVPGVNVIVIGTNFGASTNNSGEYEIKNIPSGTYSLEFSAIGFEKIRMDNIIIEDSEITIDVTMKLSIIQSEEVIVTAGKYQQKKSDLPVSAEIISGKEFTERNFSNLEDAIRYVPGVTMTEDQVSIRGSSGYGRGTGARALLAVDGLPFYTGDSGEIVWEMLPVTEFQRIEIIKGAASSLYGSAAIGGVINAITREISEKPLTIFNGFYGFYDKPYYSEWDWSGQVRPFNGITLSHSNRFGNFGFNVSLSRLEEQSYKQDDDFKKYIGFLKIVYNFTPVSSFTFVANTFNKKAGQFLYWKNSRNALIPPDQNTADRIETNRYLFGLIYKSVLDNDMILNLKTNYYRNYFKDNEVIPNESTSHLYRSEAQLTSNLNESIVLTSGLEGSYSVVKSSLFGNPDAFSIGAYAVADISFIFPLIASIGLRYDYSKLDTLNGSGAISPKLGFNYKLSKEFVIRTSIGTGFRAASIAEAFTSTSTSGITVKPNPNIKSERNITFEIGANYTPLQMMNIDFAVFQNEYYDMIEPGIDPNDGLVFFSNVLRARIQGLEASTVFYLLQNELSLNFNYSYLWARDLETGEALRYRPRHILYAGADFKKWNFDLGVNFRFTSKVEEIDQELVDLGIVVDGDLRVPVFTTDIKLSYNFSELGLPLNFYINIKNILNYNYVELIGNIRPIRNYSFGLNLAI